RAAEYLQRAVETGTAPAAVYGELLEVLWVHRHDLPNPEGRTNALIEALKNDPRFAADLDAKAIIITYRTRWNDPTDAAAQAAMAEKLMRETGRDRAGVLLAAAEVEFAGMTPENQAERLTNAERLARRATSADPTNARAGIILAEIFALQGKI